MDRLVSIDIGVATLGRLGCGWAAPAFVVPLRDNVKLMFLARLNPAWHDSQVLNIFLKFHVGGENGQNGFARRQIYQLQPQAAGTL